MRDGTSFSHGLIDFIVLSGNSSKIWLFPIVGIVYGLVYYTIFRVLIAKLDLKTPGREDTAAEQTAQGGSEMSAALVQAFGGKENITNRMLASPVCASAWPTCPKLTGGPEETGRSGRSRRWLRRAGHLRHQVRQPENRYGRIHP